MKNAKIPKATVLQMRSGRWSALLIFSMPDGVQSLEWKISPDDVKFMKALAELEGGPDKGQALWTEFQECIQDSRGELAVSLSP